MFLEQASFVASGAGLIVLVGFVMYSAVPKEGRPRSVLAATELRSTTLTIALVAMFALGIGLVLKGLVS